MDNTTKQWLREIMQDVIRGYNEDGHMESRRVNADDVYRAQSVLEFTNPHTKSQVAMDMWFSSTTKPDVTPYLASRIINAYLDMQESDRARVRPEKMYGLARRAITGTSTLVSYQIGGHWYFQGPSLHEAMLQYEVTGDFGL